MNKYPAIKVALLFIVGILLQRILHLKETTLILTIFTLLVTTLVLFVIKSSNEFYKIFFLSLLFLNTGSFFYFIEQSQNIKYPFELVKIRNSKITASIESVDLLREKKLTTTLKLLSFGNNKLVYNDQCKFVCSFWKDTTSTLDSIYNIIEVGNKISFIGTIQRAKNQRNPNEFDYENYLLSKGISGIINCYRLESVDIIDDSRNLFLNSVFEIRKAIDNRIKELYTPTTAALLKGLLLADRSDIDYKTKRYFMNTGVIHVLAVSGLHVGFISLIFFMLFARFGIKYQYVLTIIGIIFFLVLTGTHPSVFRASVMAVAFLIAKLTNRSTNGINSLAIAALIILLLNPKELFNPGFLLSFSAALSILVLYPVLSEKIKAINTNRLIKKMLLFIAVTFVAQLGTLPFTIIYFNKISIVSLFANIFVIPLIGFIVGLGILSLVVSIFSIWITSFFVLANIMLIDFLYSLVTLLGTGYFAFVPVFNFSILDGIFFYIFLFVIFFTIKKFNSKIALLVVVIFVIVSLPNYFGFDNFNLLPDGDLTVATIDVGQGDAILIKFPNNKTALIDAGNRTEYFDNGERVILPLLKSLEIDKLDYVFISHLDGDHFGGIISLIDFGIVKKLYKPLSDSSHKEIVFEEYLKKKDIKFSYYSRKSFNIDGCKLYFLNDTTDNIYKSFDINNKSGIIKLVYGNTSFLFVGDLEEEGEIYFINKYEEFLKSDVLKIGHHGSKTSSSLDFIKKVKPKIGIISAGIMNKFHHPSRIVLSRLKEEKIKIRRTDKEGAVILASDGNRIRNINWR